MHYRLRYLSLATATLLVAVTSPVFPVISHLQPVVAQTQTNKDRNAEALRLNEEGNQQFNKGQIREALEKYQQALVIFREIKDRKNEGITLNNIGAVYENLGQYDKALDFYQQALAIFQAIDDKAIEGTTLNNIGQVYWNLGQYPKALDFYQQALTIAKNIGDKATEGTTLNNIGAVYNSLGQYDKALDFYQQALAISQAIDDKAMKGTTLNNIGQVYWNFGQYPKALDFYQQALTIAKNIGDKANEGTTLNNIGLLYYSLGQYDKALDFYQQALAIFKAIGNQAIEGTTLNNIGAVYWNLGQYPKALDFYQQALTIAKNIGDKAIEGKTLNNIGQIYWNLGQYPKALDFYQQALTIAKNIGDKAMECKTLNNIGLLYDSLGQYPKALEFYQQALVISQNIGDKAVEGTNFNNIGLIYQNIGQYAKALDFYQQALTIAKNIGDKAMEGKTLNNIGAIYNSLRQYAKALDLYQQALIIVKNIGDKAMEGKTLNNIGGVYDSLGQYTKALDFYQQALAISKNIGDKAGEGTDLNNIGVVYNKLGQYAKALDFYQQALAIVKEIGYKEVEGTTLSNIGNLLEKQEQAQLAVIFLKQSVNIRETIRKDLRVLPKEQQESYTKTVAGTYRLLGDVLLEQDRVLEAQKVLDLLKVQELEDYLRNVRGNQETQQGIEYLPTEQQLLSQYNAKLTQVVQLGKELTALQKIPQASRTPTQEKQRQEIEAAQQQSTREYLNFIRSPQVVAIVQQLNRNTDRTNVDLKSLPALQDNLKKLDQDAVLLYPLILDDRLELVLATPYAPPIRRPVAVKREQLNQAIAQMRSALTKPSSNAKEPAQKLYDWLIKPLEPALKAANTKTIIYAPDGQLRYIPLAALYDGKEWLVQKYRINNITALSLTNLDKKPQSPKILAGAFSQGSYQVRVGEQIYSFGGLSGAGKEVENLVTVIPGTTKLVNQQFSKAETEKRMSDYSIIHLATHAAFFPGKPEDSIILFGNGDTANFRDVETWLLKNTDLVVLSACETGLGGKLGNGEEILGFGYLMQQAGAKAAIASLWTVDDGGTQTLMDAFYVALGNSTITKAEALRQAQIALITGDYQALGTQRGSVGIVERINSNLSQQVSNRLSHPYYWAPFILIGNGL